MSKKNKNLLKLVGIKQTAEMLNVHPATLRRWDKEGGLRAIRIGNRRGVGDRRYRLKDIERLIENGLN